MAAAPDILPGIGRRSGALLAGAAIAVLGRSANSGTSFFFEEHVLAGRPHVPAARRLPTTRAIVQAVAGNPAVIGYGGMAYGPGLLHCEIDGVAPTEENVRGGEYPISRYLRLYTVRPPQGSLKQFIDWVLGPGGQQVVGEMGYVPLFELD